MDTTCECRIIKAKQNPKVIKPAMKSVSKIPKEIIEDERLQIMSKSLPVNYNFEIPKTIWRIKEMNAKRVGLQMPEGLLLFATTIADIIEAVTGADSVIMGDVTYGACCIDDYTAKALNIDLLVHYGHSCLIPINKTSDIKILYIFVDIKIDIDHFIETIKLNFENHRKLALVSTIQFVTTIHTAAEKLKILGYSVTIPQLKPLSPGEILGCTAPVMKDVDDIICLCDGRFHLEAIVIANPTKKAYKYSPYEKILSQEKYNHEIMRNIRMEAIESARNKDIYGLILGTLGRQGSPKVLEFIQEQVKNISKTSVVFLFSEIFPHILSIMTKIDAWVQIACPRLSIDWGDAFPKPLLTSYEFVSMLRNEKPGWSVKIEEPYPMDFYANNSLGPWTPNHKCGSERIS